MLRFLIDEFKEIWSKSNVAHKKIISINIWVFIILLILKIVFTLSNNVDIYTLIVSKFLLPSNFSTFITQPWTLITYFFTHEGFFHILFNMLFLYWFGQLILDYIGENHVIALYVYGGILGGVFYIFIYNTMPYFESRVNTSVMLGASAGVYALVVGAARLLPSYTFYLMFIGPVKIKYIAIFYVLLSLYQSIGHNAGGELAHLAGAFFGYIYIGQLQKGNNLSLGLIKTLKFLQSFFVAEKSSNIKVSYKNKKSSQSTSNNNSQEVKSEKEFVNQEEIDNILDKISQSGYESLTKEEKQKLFNASKK